MVCPEAVMNASTIGSDGGESRISFDDVDDYDTLYENDTFMDQNDVSFTLNGYIRTATVRYIPSNTTSINANFPVGTITGGAANATDSKRIVVTVTSPSQEQFFLVTVVCNI